MLNCRQSGGGRAFGLELLPETLNIVYCVTIEGVQIWRQTTKHEHAEEKERLQSFTVAVQCQSADPQISKSYCSPHPVPRSHHVDARYSTASYHLFDLGGRFLADLNFSFLRVEMQRDGRSAGLWVEGVNPKTVCV